jgi:hypothetical protein
MCDLSEQERLKKIADTIAQQMGGYQTLVKTVGATNFSFNSAKYKNGNLCFKVKAGRKIGYINIILNSQDTYDIEIYTKQAKLLETIEGKYVDNLVEVIEDHTNLSFRIPEIIFTN